MQNAKLLMILSSTNHSVLWRTGIQVRSSSQILIKKSRNSQYCPSQNPIKVNSIQLAHICENPSGQTFQVKAQTGSKLLRKQYTRVVNGFRDLIGKRRGDRLQAHAGGLQEAVSISGRRWA